MVSLLTLNKLELTEMIQQELVQNPVLEEGTEIVESIAPEIDLDQAADRTASARGGRNRCRIPGATRKPPSAIIASQSPSRPRKSQLKSPRRRNPKPATDDPYGDIDFQSFDQLPERRRLPSARNRDFRKAVVRKLSRKAADADRPPRMAARAWRRSRRTSASPAIRLSEI